MDVAGAVVAVVKDGKLLLAKGYGRLTGYECKQKGFEWLPAQQRDHAASQQKNDAAQPSNVIKQ